MKIFPKLQMDFWEVACSCPSNNKGSAVQPIVFQPYMSTEATQSEVESAIAKGGELHLVHDGRIINYQHYTAPIITWVVDDLVADDNINVKRQYQYDLADDHWSVTEGDFINSNYSDAILDSESDHPIQNKAVTAALGTKANANDVYTKAEADDKYAQVYRQGPATRAWDTITGAIVIGGDRIGVYPSSTANVLYRMRLTEAGDYTIRNTGGGEIKYYFTTTISGVNDRIIAQGASSDSRFAIEVPRIPVYLWSTTNDATLENTVTYLVPEVQVTEENIALKTLNGNSLYGDGDIVIEGGGGVTPTDVEDAIDEALADYYSKTEIDAAVTTVNNALTAHTANTDVHVTSAEKTAWNNKLDASALDDYYTKADINNQTTATAAALNDLNDRIDVATGTAENAVAALQGVLTTLEYDVNQHVDDSNIHVTASDKASWNAKQDALTAGTGIAINNNVISYTGATGGSISVDSTLSTASTNPVQNKVITNALADKVDNSALNNYYTKSETDASYLQAYNALTAHTADSTVHVTATEKSTWNSKLDSTALQGYLTEADANTLYGNRIDVIEQQQVSIWCGTAAQYNAIAVKDVNTLYLIQDA